jgi:hypothetical protein
MKISPFRFCVSYQVRVMAGTGETGKGSGVASKKASEFCLDSMKDVSSKGSKSLAKLLRHTLSRRMLGTGMKISL